MRYTAFEPEKPLSLRLGVVLSKSVQRREVNTPNKSKDHVKAGNPLRVTKSSNSLLTSNPRKIHVQQYSGKQT